MRSGWWILSVCVLVGLTLAAAASDDYPLGELGTSAKESSGSAYFSRRGKTPSKPAATAEELLRYSREKRTQPPSAATAPRTKPNTKNFYQELFEEADKKAAMEAAAQNLASEKKSKQDLLFEELMRGREAEAAKAKVTAELPSNPKSNGDIIRASAETDSKDLPEVSEIINAGFEDNPTSDNQIQQIRATRGTPSPRRPAARTAAGRITAGSQPQAIKIDPSTVGPQTASVDLRWSTKGDVNVGQECVCVLTVKNTSKIAARNVHVTAFFPASARLTKAVPTPSESGAQLGWTLAALAAGEEKAFEITVIPSQRGELAASADVHFSGTTAALFAVEEPLLKLAIKGPGEVMVGDPASHLVTVSNPGTGVAHDVVIEAHVPAGLEHANGQRLVMGVGSLNPGESRAVRLALAATAGGEQRLLVEAKSSSNLRQTAEAKILVLAPSLDIKATGPSLRYLNRNAKYTVTVANNSTAATNNVRVTDVIPSGFEFVRATKGGQVDASGKTVNWFVGRLEAGQSMQLELELASREMGEFVHQIRAYGDNGAQASTTAETRIDGTAALVMEVADLDDPVEVGAETGYEIRVVNEGSKAAQNLSVACELPEGVELVAGKSSSQFSREGEMLVFKGVNALGPKESLTYRLVVRGKAAGNLRFRARLSSDSIQKPLTVEEVTKFYAD